MKCHLAHQVLCCSMLQYVAVFCRPTNVRIKYVPKEKGYTVSVGSPGTVLQHVAACCSMLQYVAVCKGLLCASVCV